MTTYDDNAAARTLSAATDLDALARDLIAKLLLGALTVTTSDYTSGQVLADQNGAGSVLTFTFATPVDMIWVTDIGSTTTNISRVDPYGGTPTANQGAVVFNATPTPIQVLPASTTIQVYAPVGSVISVYGQRYV